MTSADTAPGIPPSDATDARVGNGSMRYDATGMLRARVAELEEQLRRVTAERDEALARLEIHGAAQGNSTPETTLPDEAPDANACQPCEGEGVLWVHDFRMDCKRCGGTGRVSKQ